MELIWRESALDNLETIIAHIAERNGPAAQRLKSAIEARADGLTRHPFLYRVGRVPGTREAVVHPNYILIYRVHADAVEIVAIVHSRRRYP